MRPPVDFDLLDLILRVLEGWELGNKGLYRKHWSYIKISKKKSKNLNFILVPGVQKTDVPDLSNFFTKKTAGNSGISRETTQESRVRRKLLAVENCWRISTLRR